MAAYLRGAGLGAQGLLYGTEEQHLARAAALYARLQAALGFEQVWASVQPPLGDAAGVGESLWSICIAGAMAFAREPAEWAGRAAAAACSLGAVVLAWYAGRAWSRHAVGGLALSAVFALLPSFVWWGRAGEPTALVLLFLMAGVLALLHAVDDVSRRWGAAVSGVALGAAAAGFPVAWPVTLAIGVWLVGWTFSRSPRKPAVRVLLWWAGGCAAVVVIGAVVGGGLVQGTAAGAAQGDVLRFPYWFFRREGVAICLLGVLGVAAARRLPRTRQTLLAALLVVPIGWTAVHAPPGTGTAFPFVGLYIGVALLVAGGLSMLLTLRPRALATVASLVAVAGVLAASAPLTRTRSGSRELAAWLQEEAPAWLHSQGAQPAVVLIAQGLPPAVRFASRTNWPQTWWADPPAEAQDLTRKHGGYVTVVAEEGHLAWEWGRVQPLQRFARTVPRPVMYVTETSGVSEVSRTRLSRGAFLELAAYDAAAVGRTAEPHGVDEQPAHRAFAQPGRFSVNPPPADLAAWRRDFRTALGDVLGLTIMPQPASGEARVTERVEAAGYVRERVTLETEAGFRVPAYVLLPDGQQPAPLALVLHGHGPGKRIPVGLPATADERWLIETENRDVGVRLVRRGYAVIAPDMRGFGELMRPADIARGEPFSCPRLQLEAQLVGRSLLGERVYDAMRWIDYAERRSDIDATRPIIVGHSAGATVALFTAALDDRLAAAFVSGYFGTWAETFGHVDHCACNYVPGLARLGDIPDVAALVAPRRLQLSIGRLDSAVPLAAAQLAFPAVHRIFDAVGGRVELQVGTRGHMVYPEHLWAMLDENGIEATPSAEGPERGSGRPVASASP